MVLVQAGLGFVVLARQAQGLAQALFAGVGHAVGGVGCGPGDLARVIGQAYLTLLSHVLYGESRGISISATLRTL